ncbi:MAG TPA: hypothetical protein VHY32_12565 [Caulobacteraceae bacterium]|jgi:hypothetical protein|nr:hypothetical protein [Caulobacteraceae bacterium]
MRIQASPLFLLILLLAGSLAACAPRLDPRSDAASQAVFDQLKRHEFAGIEARLPPLRRTAVTDARLQAEAALIPDQPPQATKLVGFEVAADPDGARRTGAIREYFYPDRLLVASTTLREAPGRPVDILGFDLHAFAPAALAVGRFSLAGKSTMQYFLLGLAAAIPLLVIAALIALARDQRARLKWLWTPFIMIGLARLSVDWSTGAMLFTPFTLTPLGAAVTRGALDISPWLVSISIPLGALIYLGRLWFAARPDDGD